MGYGKAGVGTLAQDGIAKPLFNTQFLGSTVPVDRFAFTSSTWSATVQSSVLAINPTGDLTASAYTQGRTYRVFPVWGESSTCVEFVLSFSGADDPTTGSMYWGIGTPPSGNGPHTGGDGLFFGINTANGVPTLNAYVNSGTNATITSSTLRTGARLTNENFLNHRYRIEVRRGEALFQIDDDAPIAIRIPALQFALPFYSDTAPIAFGVIGGGAPVIARQLNIASVTAYQRAYNASRPPGVIAGGQHNHISSYPPGFPFGGSTTNWPNTTYPGAVTPVNTAPAFSTPGGLYAINATAGSETDLQLFAFQNPDSTNVQQAKNLMITGVRIGEMYVTGVAVGATDHIFQWALAWGDVSGNLANPDSQVTGTGVRRIPLGSTRMPAASAVNFMAAGLPVFDFSAAPICVGALQRAVVLVKQSTGTATASLVFRGMVGLYGYWE